MKYFLIIFFFFTVSAKSQWTQTNGPFGCSNTHVTKYPGGVAAYSNNGVYYTLDTGLTWNDLAYFQSKIIRSIVSSNDTVYILYENHSLLNEDQDSVYFCSSFDAGMNWSIPISFQKNPPSNRQTLYKFYNTILFNNYSSIYKSIDGGQTWTATPLPSNEGVKELKMYGRYGTVVIDSAYFGITKYLCDTALNFFQLPTSHLLDQAVMIDSVLITINNSNTPKIVYKSTDLGQSYFISRTDSLSINHLLIEDSLIYYGTSSTFFSSADSGSTFVQTTTPPHLAYDSWVKFVDGKEIYSMLSYIGISDINPDTSYAIMNGIRGMNIENLQSYGTDLYAMENTAVFKSIDQGNSWRHFSWGYLGDQLAIKGDTIVHFDASYIKRSTDGGLTFTQVSISGSFGQGTFLCFNGSDLYFVNPSSGEIYKSNDLGTNWTILTAPVQNTPCGQTTITVLSICSKDGNIYAATEEGSIWKISPNSVWTYLFCYTPNYPSSPHRPIIKKVEDKIILSSDSILYLSFDNGSSWNSAMMNGLPNQPYYDNLVGRSVIGFGSDLYCLSRNIGIYYSYNNGDDWIKFPSDYFPFIPSALTICNNQLFSGSSDKSVWTTLTTLEIESTQSINSTQLNIFPNPTNNNFTISFTSKEVIDLNIFDQFGKNVLHFDYIKNNENISVINLPNGIYFVSASDNSGKQICQKKLVIVK